MLELRFLKMIFLLMIVYLGTAAIFLLFLHKTKYFKTRKILPDRPSGLSNFEQIKYSILYLFTVAILDSVLIYLAINGHTKIFIDFSKMSPIYLVLSFVFYVLSFELYFYLSHRLLHYKYFYDYIHVTHHRVEAPSVLTTFCFHPLEAFVFFTFQLLVVMSVPMHPSVLIAGLLFFHQGNMVGHLGYELYSVAFRNKFTFLSSSTFHYAHHQYKNYNYGYFFTILDRLFRTHKDSKKVLVELE